MFEKEEEEALASLILPLFHIIFLQVMFKGAHIEFITRNKNNIHFYCVPTPKALNLHYFIVVLRCICYICPLTCC